MQQVARLMPVAGGRTLSIEFASTGDYLQHSRHPSSQIQQNRSDMAATSDANVCTGQDSTASGVGSAEGVKKHPSDGAESDDKSASVEDLDVLAPSDMTHEPKHDQTGLNTTIIQEAHTGFDDSMRVSHSGVEVASLAEGATISDDDEYAGVDLISESGDEDQVVDFLEQKAISDSERDVTGVHHHSPPSLPYDAFSFTSTEVGQVDFDIDPFLTDDIFFKEQINILDHQNGAMDTDYFASTDNFGFASPLVETPRRRVRFADPLMLPSEVSRLSSSEADSDGTSARLADITSNKSHHEHASSEQKPHDGQVGPADGAIHSSVRSSNPDPLRIFEPMNTDDDEDDNNGDLGSSVGSSSGYESGS